jgi:hypothetical protein
LFDEIPQPEKKVLKRHQNSDDPCIMAWDHYSHPRARTNLHRQGNSTLGKDKKEVAQNNRKDLLSHEPLTPTNHIPSFPTCLFHLKRVHLHYYKSIDHYASLTLGFNNKLDRKSQSTLTATGLPLGELTSQQTLSPGRVDHMLDNLLLQFIS